MDPEVTGAEGADSLTATQVADPSQATTQPVQNGDPQYKGFHEHPDWQRMVAERRQDRQTIAQMRQDLQRFQQTQQNGQPKSEEDLAREALHKLAPGIQKVDQLEGAFRNLLEQQSRSNVNRAVQHIGALAKAEGLPQDKEYLGDLVKLVALKAQALQDGDSRFNIGDFSVLDEAFKAVNGGFLSHHQRQQTAGLAATKNNLIRTVPPRQTGSQSGATALQPIVPGKEREHLEDAHRRAEAMVAQMRKG